MFDGDESALRLSALFQMTMPGAPCIYYGDEIGMTGATDPDCRGAFPWNERDSWNSGLLTHYRKAIDLRRKHKALRTGTLETVYSQDGVYGFVRSLGSGDSGIDADDERMLVLFNTNRRNATIALPDANRAAPDWAEEDVRWSSLWNHCECHARNGQLVDIIIPARDALILKQESGRLNAG